MSKKLSLLLLLTAMLTSLLVILFLRGGDNNSTKAPSKKAWFTPGELRQKQMDFKKERRSKGYRKSDGPDHYARFQYAIRTREGHSGPEYASNYKLDELEKAKDRLKLHNKRVAALEWIERGPANVPGRTRALLVMPDDPSLNTWMAGSAGGGIWKTTDGGASWTFLTPGFPNLSVSALAFAPSQPDVIYAGTGEGFFNLDAINGDGVFKSVNGGASWMQLAATANNVNFQNVNRIIVHPDNPNLVLACTNTGRFSASRSAIMRSTNGGGSWSQVYASANRVQQLVFTPGNFNVQYAAVNGVGVLKSTNGGMTWTDASAGLEPLGRIELAIAPTDPQYIYASVEGNVSGSGSDLYVSTNAGASWVLVVEDNQGQNVNWLGNQGWYNNSVAVHPFNKNIVYVGGINLWKMAVSDPREDTAPQPAGADTVNTFSFLAFVNFGGLFMNGGITTGENWFKDDPNYPVNVTAADYTDVEIRFGSGRSQKAHRFTVPLGAGSGVAPADYTYQDYVEVPFEVWDVSQNRQLMASFRDQDRNGQFDLEEIIETDPLQSREYLFVHAADYNEITPQPDISKAAGMAYENIYSMWPALAPGATWNPSALPESRIEIYTIRRAFRTTTNISDMYREYNGKNENVHVDHHAIVPVEVSPANGTFSILNGNDGGVYVSNTGTDPGVAEGSWTAAGTTYNTSQLYGADKKRGSDEYIGGIQDNGTWRSNPTESASSSTEYLFQISGDGFDVVWNYADPNKIIGSAQFNSFWRSLDGGAKWQQATSGLTDSDEESAPFISKLENAKNNPDVLFAVGASGVWRSDNFGGTWSLTPIQNGWTFGSFTDVKISLANNTIVWAGGAISNSGKLHVSTDGGETFTPVNGYSSPMGSVTGLATHPLEDSTAYALFSFSGAPKILRTTNLGNSWQDITGFTGSTTSSRGFPNVAVYSLFVFPNEPNRIWAGTEIGLVESTDNGTSWNLANNGLPNTAIWDMRLVDNQLVVATHGRGIWTVELDVETVAFFAPFINRAGISPQGNLVLDLSLRSAYDSITVIIDNRKVYTSTATSASNQVIRIPDPPTGDSIFVAVDAYSGTKTARSNHASLYSFEVSQYLTQYSADFNETTQSDFIGRGFEVIAPENFTSRAVHSKHNYELNREYTYMLIKPVVIARENSAFIYEDVALIEPGETGSAFPTEAFYDYVVVEGTKDGISWIPILDGYDARFNPTWLNAYQRIESGGEEMFVRHNIDLLSTFSANDTVLFRFRLYSDPGESGWGWAIDNLLIQTQEPVAAVQGIDQGLSLYCYPQPAVGEVTIAFDLPRPGPVEFVILNASGQTIKQFKSNLGKTHGEIKWTPPGSGVFVVRMHTQWGKRSVKLVVRE